MVEVIPLKYGVTFKRVFSDPEIFSHFASDVVLTSQPQEKHLQFSYAVSNMSPINEQIATITGLPSGEISTLQK